MTCRKCRWFAVPLSPSGLRRVFKNRVYACTFNTDNIALPDSITQSAFNMERCGKFVLQRRFMTPDDGATCPTFEARK